MNHALSDLEPEPLAIEMVDKQDFHKKMVDKWSIKASLAEKLVDSLVQSEPLINSSSYGFGICVSG